MKDQTVWRRGPGKTDQIWIVCGRTVSLFVEFKRREEKRTGDQGGDELKYEKRKGEETRREKRREER